MRALKVQGYMHVSTASLVFSQGPPLIERFSGRLESLSNDRRYVLDQGELYFLNFSAPSDRALIAIITVNRTSYLTGD